MERVAETGETDVGLGGLVGIVEKSSKRTHRKPRPVDRLDIVWKDCVVISTRAHDIQLIVEAYFRCIIYTCIN